MKKLSFLILALFILTLSPKFVSARQVEIYLDGQKIETDVAPRIVKDRTLVPIRFISESLGYKVDWDNDARKVLIDGESSISLTIDQKNMLVNGKSVSLDVAPTIIEDRTMVPLRAISEAFGLFVDWDHENYRVILERRQLNHLNEREKEYFLALQKGQKVFISDLRKMQDALSKDMANLSKTEILTILDKTKKSMTDEIARMERETPPEKFVPIHDLYIKALANGPSMVESYKEAYLEGNQEAATSLVSKFFYLNLQVTELEKAMKAMENGQVYIPSHEYKDFNDKVNKDGSNNIFSDDIIGNLLKQL